ncbi:hypothetical protein [Gordonia soli]|uniref:hypothetical protein n=1 Tax=Gordonia soli TaxID=320799 RepID=UPI0005912F8A|nr:hypothetical protein [Gordonia soli]
MKTLRRMHTLSTDHVYVEAISEYERWTPAGERAEIWRNLDLLVVQLDSLDITYNDLRNALCPRQDKREACLMFDSEALAKTYGDYAYGASNFIVPLLPTQLNTAIRHGDLISENRRGDVGYLASTYPHLRLDGVGATEQIYCVHLSNLSPGTRDAIELGLRGTPGFIGVVDTTLQSPIKNLISGTLSANLLKAGSTYISAHYDEIEPKEGVYEGNWDLGTARTVSVFEVLFGQYLVYKIQRSSDGALSRNEALILTSLDASYSRKTSSKIDVSITDSKFDYLTSAKGVNLENMGLGHLTSDQLCSLVLDKVRHHYLYGLRLLENGDLLCSTLIELERAGSSSYRAEVGLRLEPDDDTFHITTFY